jgi:hypothetical protein
MLLAAAALKACALLTAADIAAVQGEKPTEARESSPQAGASHCFFALPTTAKSISLEVTRGGQVSQLVDRIRGAAEVEAEEAGEHEEHAVERVRGLGDEAYWAGGAKLGGLYVRRGDALLRISVGGAESHEAKLKKLRRLARRALSRLPK